MFRKSYGEVFAGDERWNGAARCPRASASPGTSSSTYVRLPPYFEDMPRRARRRSPTSQGARVLALLGDSVTTDHISPAGAIKRDGPAGAYLQEHGVAPRDFNSYGSRRGNHEVMMRGTFANIRLRNQLAPGTEGCRRRLHAATSARHEPSRCRSTTRRCATPRRASPLVVLAGKEYGSGSSRDWAAKGTKLLGVRAVIAQSFERIHRSNLVGMGVLPLQFPDGESAAVARADRRGGVLDRRPRRGDARRSRARSGGARSRCAPSATAPSRSSSTRACASTRRARPSTSATAASSSSSCASCSPHERRGGRCRKDAPQRPARPARRARALRL